MTSEYSRRKILRSGGLEATPRQPAGPFYHPIEPLSVDNDLLYHQDPESLADGEVIFIRGRLLDQTGKPIKDARIEIWQANAYGRYNHPRHANSNLPLDTNFFGFGHTLTEPEGHYRFRSIKPAPYPTTWNGYGRRTFISRSFPKAVHHG